MCHKSCDFGISHLLHFSSTCAHDRSMEMAGTTDSRSSCTFDSFVKCLQRFGVTQFDLYI